MQENVKSSRAAQFRIGDKVRVRHGVMDDEFTMMAPVSSDGARLASIHPVFRNRCENDGLNYEQYSLGADDLERDTGAPLDIEQHHRITTRPLSLTDQDDRIRIIFGLTSNDTLPDVDDLAMEAYHEHLSTELAFPFTADHGGEYGHPERVKVIGLGDADEPMIDEMYGILCEARMEGHVVTLPLGELDDVKGKQNLQLIEDYCYWLHHFA